MLPHQKRPPRLEDLLIAEGRPRKRRGKTAAEMEAVARQWHAVLSVQQPKRKTREA